MNLKEEKIASKINSSFLREEQFRADMKCIELFSYNKASKKMEGGSYTLQKESMSRAIKLARFSKPKSNRYLRKMKGQSQQLTWYKEAN